MKTFADYVKYYNNADVIGFTEAITKYLALKQTMGLDVFKVSISLPGLTKRYLFQNLPKGDYFSGFGEEHKWLVKETVSPVVHRSFSIDGMNNRLPSSKILTIIIGNLFWVSMPTLYTCIVLDN